MNTRHRLKVPVHVDVQVKADCPLALKEIETFLSTKLAETCQVFQRGVLNIPADTARYVDNIVICDLPENAAISFWQAELCLHAYRLSDQGPEGDFLEGEEEQQCAAEQWELPNKLLHGFWDSIVVDESIKQMLLSYCSSSIQFSDARIDSDIISWNRMILIYGPPGTGKTTICKALAQKMYIRNSDKFSSGILLEVNSHSLFSKWFSESGKLVMKLFNHINEIAEDEECLVVVLIDEVESISSSRTSSSKSNEPGDAVRVVNAVLTSLDALKRRPNVLVLCTSNIVSSLDPAFLDRVDLKVHLGPPPLLARLRIVVSFLDELMKKGMISPSVSLSGNLDQYAAAAVDACVLKTGNLDAFLASVAGMSLDSIARVTCGGMNSSDISGGSSSSSSSSGGAPRTDGSRDSCSNGSAAVEGEDEHPSLTTKELLYSVALVTEGWSGRGLRKLPIKAHAYFIQRQAASVDEFLLALLSAVQLEKAGATTSEVST